jgi:cation diffusion facilitator family transporter
MDPAPSQATSQRVLLTGVVVNTALAVLKIVGGLLSGSPSLLADGYHSLGDLGTNGLAWLTWRWAQLPPDEDHHYGHGKVEAAAALLVGAVLMGTGGVVVWEASHGTSPSYEGSEAWTALGVALLSMGANEFLTRITKREAQRTGSPTLAALAADNRSDMLTSVLVLVGVSGSSAGLPWLEVVLTAVIGLFVGWMGIQTSRSAFDTLTDRVPDTELRGRVRSLAEGLPGVLGVQTIAVHPLGSQVRVDMEISVDGALTVAQGHEIAHQVEQSVKQAEDSVVQVAVHVNPAGICHP